MRIEYSFDIEDHVEFTMHHMRRSPTAASQRRLAVWIPPVALIFLGSILFLMELWFGAALCLVVVVFWLFWYPGHHDRHLRRQVRKLLNEGANKGTHGPQELELASECLIHRTPFSDSAHRYEALEAVEETDEFALLYLSAASAHVVPRRKVSAGDYRAFVASAKKAVAEAKAHAGALSRAPRLSTDRVFRREEGSQADPKKA